MSTMNPTQPPTPYSETTGESPAMYMETEEEDQAVSSDPTLSTASPQLEPVQVNLQSHELANAVLLAQRDQSLARSNPPTKPLTPLQARLSSYRIPQGFGPFPLPKCKNNRSIIYDYGVRMLGVRRNNTIDKWHCLAPRDCNTDILVVKNTSNITNHLKRIHNVKSLRSDKMMKKRTETKIQYNRAAQYIQRFLHDPEELNRVHEVNLTKVIVQNLDLKGHFKNKMTNKHVRHRIVEMYITTRDLIIEELDGAIQDCPIPVFHLNVDFWTSKVSHDKYCGLRLFFVDAKWELKSVMLGIRLFSEDITNPKVKLSERLLQWSKDVLREFKIAEDSVLSCTSDAGSDVKRLCVILLPSKWDWCVAHLTNCALVEAFGTSLQASSCKNKEFRFLLKKVKKLIEHINKSPEMRARFEDLQFQERGTRLRFIRDMPHRWLGTIRLIQRFLSLWDTIRLHYVLHEKVPFPVDAYKDELIECFSLMKPIGDLITMAQATNYPVGIDVFLELCCLKRTVLCPGTPLAIYDPTIAGYSPDGEPIAYREPVQLQPMTSVTRVLLADAMRERFYDGYHGTERSTCLETQVFMHPSYKQLRCLHSIPSPSEAAIRRQAVIDDVFDMMLKVAKVRDDTVLPEQASSPEDGSTDHTEVRDRASTVYQGRYEEFADCVAEETVESPRTTEDIVREELDTYIEIERVHSSALPTRKLLEWWKSMRTRYPCLSVVARCVLGHVVSAAQIERDFGAAGNLISGKRSQLSHDFVDMTLVLKLNFHRIPSKPTAIRRIAHYQDMSFLPSKRSLLEAETSLGDEPGDETDEEDGLWGE